MSANKKPNYYWELEMSGVREDDDWKYPKGDHFSTNVVLVLNEQLKDMTDKCLLANEYIHDPYGRPWNMDPDDTFGFVPKESLEKGTYCDYPDRKCM